MPQMAFDGGQVVSEPYAHYKQNRAQYEYITARLDGTRESYLEADPHKRLRLLFDSATYALLTAHCPLEQADRAFDIYADQYPDVDADRLATAFEANGIGFYSIKAEAIEANADRVEEIFLPVDRALVDGRTHEAQEYLMEANRLGPAKSAFTLAMLGFTDHACLDVNVCKYFGVDPRDYGRHNSAEYQALVSEIFDQVPDLADEVSVFVLQWVIFDLRRGYVETHDNWFAHVTRAIS